VAFERFKHPPMKLDNTWCRRDLSVADRAMGLEVSEREGTL